MLEFMWLFSTNESILFKDIIAKLLLIWLQQLMLENIFGENLDFLKIKQMKNVCYDAWTCTKMWKQCYF